jgi:hypothetical protein
MDSNETKKQELNQTPSFNQPMCPFPSIGAVTIPVYPMQVCPEMAFALPSIKESKID